MNRIFIGLGLAVTSFFLISFVIGSLNPIIWAEEPDRIAIAVIFFSNVLLPALAAGYFGGRIASASGLLVGLTSSVIGLALFDTLLQRGLADIDLSSHIAQVLVWSLASAVGQLHSLQAKTL